MIIILISIYLLSILGCRWTHRRMGSRGLDMWLDEDCTIDIIWFIPWVNTTMAFSLFILVISKFKMRVPKNKFFRKLTNHD